ncbi:MAG: hypothetical protein GEU93_12365 [Propionibacteriales bacterium]|nr:hypothetical protein [Propionibacteriales bacterium]
MSSFPAPARPRARSGTGTQRRAPLSVVRGRVSRGPGFPFAALVLVVLGVGFAGLLILNTSLQQGAFYARGLEERATLLAERQQALEMQVAHLRKPQHLSQRAQQMGMVSNDSPAFLRLADGAVLGRPVPATRAPEIELPPDRGQDGDRDRSRDRGRR